MDLLMDLSKVFDALNHVFLLGKNHACSIDRNSVKVLRSNLVTETKEQT